MPKKPQLTFEDFRRLPRDVQSVRYPELLDHDKFLARITDGSWSLNPEDRKGPLLVETLEELSDYINNGFKKPPSGS